jgi:putative acetyltransferase
MILRQVHWDDPDATALRAAQRAEIETRYGTPDSEPGPAPSATDSTVFFVAYGDDGEPLGCGGLRRLDDTEGEIKRMYVAPSHRGSGVSGAILDALEDFGRRSGWSRLVLETGTAQPDALRLYRRAGYTSIPNFGHYSAASQSLCFEKALFASDPNDDAICEGCQ